MAYQKIGDVDEEPNSPYRRVLASVVSVAAVVGTAAVVSNQQQLTSLYVAPAPLDSPPDAVALSDVITITNSYTADGMTALGANYPWMEDYEALLEPNKMTTFAVAEPDDSSYTWTVSGMDSHYNENDVTFTGSNFSFACSHPNRKYSVELQVVGSSGDFLSISGDIFCKYVRREIRKLSDDDRTAFITALKTLYSYSTEEGRQLYGPQFKSVYDFVKIHNTLSGRVDCDHLHGGLGFLPQHAAMTYSLELALQSVDASVSMPYWDFTIEAYRANTTHEWYLNSEMFGNDWFGPMGTDASGYNVASGVFAYTAVPLSRGEFNTDTNLTVVTNPYGLLRSPWNTNPVPYLGRSQSSYGFALDPTLIPGCSQHYDVMKEEEFSGFGDSIQEAPHGSLHILIGGVWNANWAGFLADRNYSYSRAQPLGTVTMARVWRNGWMTCPTYCSLDTPESECKCSCPDISDWTNQSLTKKMVKNMYPGLTSAPDFLLDDNGNDLGTDMLKLFCNDYSEMNPRVGDFMQSSSPLDPFFWPTHPTLDRLWHWRKINGFLDESWDNSGCWGHKYNDTTIWHDLFDDGDYNSTFYTIAELMDLFSPMSVTIPYVYDDFEWKHCEEQGYPLNLISEDTGTALDDDAGATDSTGKATRSFDDDGSRR